MKKSRLLLLALPFGNSYAPNIGLSLLKSSAAEAGFECDIKYLNTDFEAEVGSGDYKLVAQGLRTEALIGDAVFAEALHGHKIDFSKLYSPKHAHLYGKLSGKVKMLEEMSEKAKDFIHRNIAEIRWENYSMVGFSAMFQLMPSLAFSYNLKKTIKNAPKVIFGGSQTEGPLGKAVHEHFSWIDFVCRGEGETLIKLLLSNLEGEGISLSEIPGLIYREGSQSVANGVRTPPEVLNDLPYADYSDWLAQLESSGLDISEQSQKLAVPLETSRGCWYGEKSHCTFCGLNGEGMAFRRKTPDRAFSEIMNAKRLGINFLFAVDNILDYSYFGTLLPRLASMGDKPVIFYEVKANLKKDQLRLLKDAGVYLLQPGIESLNTNVLNIMNKGVRAIQNLQLLKWSAELGISLAWNLLYNFPNEQPEDYEAMEQIIPKIVHLQPPAGIFPIRLDRFSPLHSNASGLGVKSLKASPAYIEVFQLSGEDTESISSFFEFEREDGLDARSYTRGLRENVDEWIESRGKFALIYWDDGKVVNIVDTRPSAVVSHAILSGVEREVLLACDAAQLPTKVSQKLGVCDEEILSLVARFVENGWFVNIDKHIMSLAVNVYNKESLAQYPAPLLSVVFTEAYKHNMNNISSVFS